MLRVTLLLHVSWKMRWCILWLLLLLLQPLNMFVLFLHSLKHDSVFCSGLLCFSKRRLALCQRCLSSESRHMSDANFQRILLLCTCIHAHTGHTYVERTSCNVWALVPSDFDTPSSQTILRFLLRGGVGSSSDDSSSELSMFFMSSSIISTGNPCSNCSAAALTISGGRCANSGYCSYVVIVRCSQQSQQ